MNLFFTDNKTNLAFMLGGFCFFVVSLLLFCMAPPGAPVKENDSNGYRKQIECFLKTGHFRPPKADKNLLMHPPGFVLCMTPLYYLSNNKLNVVVFFQVLLALINIFLLVRIAQLVFDNSTARTVALLASFNFGYLVYAQFLLMETVVAFFLTFFWERFFRFTKTFDNHYLMHAGLLLGFSLWFKPVALYYGPLVLGFLWFLDANSTLTKIYRILFFGLCFYIPFIVLATYNWWAYGIFGNSSTFKQGIFSYFIPQVIALKEGITISSARLKVNEELAVLQLTRSMLGFIYYFFNNFIIASYVWLFNMLKTYFGLYLTQIKVLINPSFRGGDGSYFMQQSHSVFHRMLLYFSAGSCYRIISILGCIEALWNVVRSFFLLASFSYFLHKKKIFKALFFGITMLYFIGITGHDGMARYRMMIEPIVLLLVSNGLMHTIYFFEFQKYTKSPLKKGYL